MTRNVILISLALLLALSACAPQAAPTQTAALEAAPVTEGDATPYPPAPPTPTPWAYPEPGEASQAEAAEPTPYPEPQQPASDSDKVTFTDDLDRAVDVALPAQRIITLGPSSLESLFAIGAGDQIVGREDFSTYPEAALQIPSVGSLWGELPAEAILALEPDLVIAPEIIAPEQVQALADLGLTVYFQANPVDFDGLYTNLRTLAQLSGHESEAETLIADLSARLQAVEEKISVLSYRPTVFYELDATDPENPYTIGAGTFIDTLISLSGGFNIGQALAGQYAPISSEEIIAQNPEIILLADAPYGVTPEVIAARAGWEAIAAVENGKVFEFDPFLVSVPGPRMVDGLEAMAKLLHPEAFE